MNYSLAVAQTQKSLSETDCRGIVHNCTAAPLPDYALYIAQHTPESTKSSYFILLTVVAFICKCASCAYFGDNKLIQPTLNYVYLYYYCCLNGTIGLPNTFETGNNPATVLRIIQSECGCVVCVCFCLCSDFSCQSVLTLADVPLTRDRSFLNLTIH